MPYKPILATLGYVLCPERKKTLMIHRNHRPEDLHLGKYNGLGGKLDSTEDIISCMRREIREEAGIECLNLQLRGTISWPGFGKAGEDWFGFIFLIESYSGVPHKQNAEGTLEWISIDSLLRLEIPLWSGDKYFLPLVFGEKKGQFHGVMPYQEGQPLSWNHHWL